MCVLYTAVIVMENLLVRTGPCKFCNCFRLPQQIRAVTQVKYHVAFSTSCQVPTISRPLSVAKLHPYKASLESTLVNF